MFDIQIEFGFRLLFLILGACVGSFVTMASYRLVQENKAIGKRSHCPKCKKTLKVRSLIPIFSWLFQKGRCTHCKEKISIRYLIIELITSILFLITYFKLSLTWDLAIAYLIITTLMIMIVTDIEKRIIPDSIQIFLAIMSFVYIIFYKISMSERLISAIIYFSLIYSICWIISKIKKQEVIGGGDIKLMTISGLFLGIANISEFLFLSGSIGLILALSWRQITGQKRFPFGPAIAISLFLCLYFYN